LTRSLSLGAIGISVAPSGASLAFALSNPGNTLISGATGSVTISQGGAPLFSQGVELGPFVPQTAITYHVPWEGTPAEGTYRVKGEIVPSGARPIAFDRTVVFGRSAVRQYRRQTGRPATESAGTSVVVIVLLVLAVAAAVAFAIAYARASRDLRDGK
jgi:hypothetical protein